MRNHDPVLMTKKIIIAKFCTPALLAEKRQELEQIEREIKRVKSTECSRLTAALFRDRTFVKKQIAVLERAK